MKSQRESVFNAVINVMGEQDGAYSPSKDERANIIAIVTESILEGETTFSESAQDKHDTPEKVKTYVNGLVSNWLRKDKRLNGGVQYVPKNPGSRTGMNDKVVRNLRALLKTDLTDEQTKRCEQELARRIAEIKAAKQPTVEVDYSELDPAFLEELGIDPDGSESFEG